MEISGPLAQKYLESHIHILFLLLSCSETWGKFLSLSFLICEMSGHLLSFYIFVFHLYFGERFGERLPEQERSYGLIFKLGFSLFLRGMVIPRFM